MTKRDELCADLQIILKKNNANDKLIKQYIKEMMDKHSLPSSKIFDYVTLREVVSVLDDTLLFCLCEAIAPEKLALYYTKKEISSYSKWKFVDEDRFTIPHIFEEVLEMGPDQWFTITSAKELIRMGNSQILRYNATTQRPLQIITHGKVETYIPYYNRHSGEAIKESYVNGKFIPNYITINIPDGYKCIYDRQSLTLEVKDAPYFDLIDGYHRYRSLLEICGSDKDFDYPMGLQITQFSEGKAKYFIYQEDQKTKMARSASRAMDIYAAQNKIVSRLNNDAAFVMCGKINQNTGAINSADLGAAIAKLYSDDNIIESTKEIREGIEELISQKPDLENTKWERKYIFTVIFMIKHHIPASKVDPIYHEVMKSNMFNGDSITRADTRKMNDILKKKGGARHV